MLRGVLTACANDAEAANGSIDLFATFARYDETPLYLICVDSIDILSLPKTFRTGLQ